MPCACRQQFSCPEACYQCSNTRQASNNCSQSIMQNSQAATPITADSQQQQQSEHTRLRCFQASLHHQQQQQQGVVRVFQARAAVPCLLQTTAQATQCAAVSTTAAWYKRQHGHQQWDHWPVAGAAFHLHHQQQQQLQRSFFTSNISSSRREQEEEYEGMQVSDSNQTSHRVTVHTPLASAASQQSIPEPGCHVNLRRITAVAAIPGQQCLQGSTLYTDTVSVSTTHSHTYFI